MSFTIPETLRACYQDRAAEIAPELLTADGIVIAEPIGTAVADGILQSLARRGASLPPTIRAEIGGPLWTRFLRGRSGVPDQPGNPYVDPMALTGYMPEDLRAEFRVWLIQHHGLSDHAATHSIVHRWLQELAGIVRGIPSRPVTLVALAAEPCMEEDSDPYVLEEIANVIAPARQIAWRHISIMARDWFGDIETANPHSPEARHMRSLVERASYDPQSLPLDERPQLAHFLEELRSKLQMVA
jgi:hypothetical protein